MKFVGAATLAVSAAFFIMTKRRASKIQDYFVQDAPKIDRSHKILRNHLGTKISHAYLCESPLSSSRDYWATKVAFGSLHHQIIFETDKKVFYLFSYGKNGLQITRAFDQDILQKHRPQNKVKKKLTNVNKTLGSLINQIEVLPRKGKDYSVLRWNCRNFSSNLWDSLNKS